MRFFFALGDKFVKGIGQFYTMWWLVLGVRGSNMYGMQSSGRRPLGSNWFLVGAFSSICIGSNLFNYLN